VPSDVYSQVRVSTATLYTKLKPCGALGNYLFENMMAFNQLQANRFGWPRGEDWTLGDSPSINLLMDIQGHTDLFNLVPAPLITADMKYIQEKSNRKIRVYKQIDVRTLLDDLFAKIYIYLIRINKVKSCKRISIIFKRLSKMPRTLK
jgi:purine nucleosidase